MLQIAENEINSFNGLAGDGERDIAAAQTGGTSNNGWQTAQNMIDSTSTLINAGANFVDSLNNNSSSSNGTNYTPYNYNWGVTPAPQKQTDYVPWILGGLGVVLLFGVVMFNKK